MDISNGLCKIFTKFINNVESNYTTTRNCLHKFKSGKNIGQYCSKKAINNGYCKQHQSATTELVGAVLNKGYEMSGKKPTTMTKTQLQIIEWLNTAVPQTETVLKKRSKGLLNEETEIVFNDNFVAIGRLHKNNIIKLSENEVRICETRAWKYDQNAVEIELDD